MPFTAAPGQEVLTSPPSLCGQMIEAMALWTETLSVATMIKSTD